MQGTTSTVDLNITNTLADFSTGDIEIYDNIITIVVNREKTYLRRWFLTSLSFLFIILCDLSLKQYSFRKKIIHQLFYFEFFGLDVSSDPYLFSYSSVILVYFIFSLFVSLSSATLFSYWS